MIESDKQAFADAVREVLKSYRQECGSFTLRVWWTALQQHDIQTVLNAMGEYCAHPDKCKFAPKAGDIVGMIEGTGKDKEALAHVAWRRLLDNCSAYDTTVFDDAAIHYAISIAFPQGWQSVGHDNIGSFEEQEHKRSFILAYTSYKEGMNYPKKLVGIFERDNGANGIEYNQVKYIGDNKKALAVESGGRTAISESVGSITSSIVPELKSIE